jgi:hypothetical protein
VNKSHICWIPACWFVSQITTSRASPEAELLLEDELVEESVLLELVSELLPPHAVNPTTIVAITNNAVSFFFIK